MSKHNLKLSDVMTVHPFTLRGNETLGKAYSLMQEKGIRHVVVLNDGKLAGVLSERDLTIAVKFANNDKLPIEEFMATEIYSVDKATPLNEVVLKMAAAKLGSTIALEDGKPVGIFTTVDALRVLGEIL